MKNLDKTLIKLAQLLNSNHINWALGGSLLLKLSGIDLEVNDIDIMIHENDFESCISLLREVSFECEVKESDIFKTRYYRKFKWDTVEIDCMSGMSLHLSSHIFNYQYDHKDKDIKFDNTYIPLCYIEDWYILYHLMPHRESKVNMIEDYYKSHPINKSRINSLLELDIPYDKRIRIDAYKTKMNML